MLKSRKDLSDWVLHFVHDGNPDHEPVDDMLPYDYFQGFPYHEDRQMNDRFDPWRISDEYYQLDPSESAIGVLLKIVNDGHIRATWAFRNDRPTIYGPRAAVCLTEMPLYALLDYAKKRAPDVVGTYAIGVLKQELFRAGGRPVIYGLSSRHVEAHGGNQLSRVWPRKLHESCGISEAEQYRYVSMAMDEDRQIDWSHEREWRWADHKDKCRCPGLPIWLSDEPTDITSAYVVVQSSQDAAHILRRLQELYDAGANDFDHPFNKGTLQNTKVVCLDELRAALSDEDISSLRLEDVPAATVRTFGRPAASAALVADVESALANARRAANEAAEEYLRSASRTSEGHVADVAGWAQLLVGQSQSEFVSALLELDEAYPVPGEGYVIRIGGLGWKQEQALGVADAAVRGAKASLSARFPNIRFAIKTGWD